MQVMFSLVVLLGLGVAYAFPDVSEILNNYQLQQRSKLPQAPVFPKQHITTYSAQDHSKSEIRDNYGQYQVNVVSPDARTEDKGVLKNGKTGQYLVRTGSIEYITPDGRKVSYKYTADENGFKVHNH